MASKTFPRLAVLAALALFSAALCGAGLCDDVKQEMSAAAETVRPALVRIHVISTDYRQGRETRVESGGSGVIISPDGYVVTNHHVASDAERLFCTLADKREVEAKLVGTDPLSDLAVIRLVSPDGKPFPYAEFGDSSKLQVGDRVYAMGSPLSLSQSVTMGIVSNIEMIMPDFIPEDWFQIEGENVGSIVRWIGHDALIAPGNSGGPLVSRDGKVVGVNEIELGLSGAIPSNLAKGVVEQIIKQGKVTRSWLGVEVQPLLDSSGLDRGILISGTLEGSEAEKAGIKSGDVLLKLDGKDVTARFREEIPIFNQFVADLPVGKAVEAVVLRDGKEIQLTVTTAERPRATEKQHEISSWGICATNITYLMQKERQLPSQDGVFVTSVLPGGPSGTAKPPLDYGDVITRVAGEPVKDIAELRAASKRIIEQANRPDGPAGPDLPVPTLVEFRRKGEQYATVISIGKRAETPGDSEITKAWLPIEMQVLTRELSEALGVPGKTGVRVTRVYPSSSADKAGLKVGDLILKLDGEEIPAEQVGDEEVLPSMIRQYDIGAEVKLDIRRDGKDEAVSVKLEASPKPPRDYPKYEDELFDFTARDIAVSDRKEGGIGKDQQGAYVQSVAEGSWASVGKLKAGDVIVAFNNDKITNLADLKAALAKARDARPKAVVMTVRRGIHTLFLEIKPEWSVLDQ